MPDRNTWGDRNEDGDEQTRDSNGRTNAGKKRPRSAPYRKDSTTEQQAQLRSLGFSNARLQSTHSSADVPDMLHIPLGQKSTIGIPQRGSHGAQPDNSSGSKVDDKSQLTSSSTAGRVARITATALEGSHRNVAPTTTSAEHADLESLFEVTFKSAGPLGITFEWAADTTSWPAAGNASSPHSAQSLAVAAPPSGGSLLPRRTKTKTSLLLSSEPDVRSASGGRNLTNVNSLHASPTSDFRRPSLATSPLSSRTVQPSTLPALSSSSSSAASSSILDSYKCSQYALRIQSFPALPGGATSSTLLPASVEHTATLGTDKAANPLTCAEKSSGKQHDIGSGSEGTSEVDGPKGASSSGSGPTAELLRLGDILVAVNGTPVAGPDARRAGITSFEDVVKIVAGAVNTKEANPRVLTFKRGGHLSVPCFPSPMEFPPTVTPMGSGANGVTTRVRSGSGAFTGVSSGREMDFANDFASSKENSQHSHPKAMLSSTSLTELHEEANQTDETFAELSPTSTRSVRSNGTARTRGSGIGNGLEKIAAGERKKIGVHSGALAVSWAAALKEKARCTEAALEPFVSPMQQLLRGILENSEILQPLEVRLSNISYWYNQRRVLGGFRHMYRRAGYDVRTKKWDASLYILGDRPSDGKLMPMLSSVGSMNTEAQALAQANKSARERDSNPGAVRGPKPRGMTPSTLLHTHFGVLVVSDTFSGLAHSDRLALVFETLHAGLHASVMNSPATFPTRDANALSRPLLDAFEKSVHNGTVRSGNNSAFDDGSNLGSRSGTHRARQGSPSSQSGRDAADRCSWGGDGGSGVSQVGRASVKPRRIPLGAPPQGVAGNVKASFVGPNVEELPVWGGLDWIAGTDLLVDCRTPEQWRAEHFQPTAPDMFGSARSGHRTLANHARVGEASVRKSLEKIVGESKVLREASSNFEHFDRFTESAGGSKNSGGLSCDNAPETDNHPSGSTNGKRQKKGVGRRRHVSKKPHAGGVAGGEPRGERGEKRTEHHKYPHFFYGLPPNARRLVMETYAENRSRLLSPRVYAANASGKITSSLTAASAASESTSAAPSEGSSLSTLPTTLEPRVSFSSRQHGASAASLSPSPRSTAGANVDGTTGNAQRNVEHASNAFAASGPPPDLDAGIFDRHAYLLARLAEAALRIQRARRLRALPRAARRLRRRQRSALAVQRFFRGFLGRRYAGSWRVVSGLAATRISAGWKMFVARSAFLVLRARARAGATMLQTLFRGHVARMYAAWCANHHYATRSIQAGVRGFIARCRARALREDRSWRKYGLPALISIQRTVRGFLVRQAYARRFKEAIRVKVVIPAAGVIAKCWRGMKGRRKAAHRRLRNALAVEIQRHARGFMRRRWWARVLRCRLKHAMATKIAAVGRGYIDRELMKARAAQRYFLLTVKPAAVLIQSQWRGYTKRRDLAAHKQRWLAALFIQVAYRGALFRRKARRKYKEWLVLHKGYSATKIQCTFRRWKAFQDFKFKLVEASWRRTFASRIILRTWRSYKLNIKLTELKEQWRVEKTALALAEAQKEIVQIQGDLDLCLKDISTVKKSIKNTTKRRKDLVEFRKEAEMRLLILEREIDALDTQDMERGWAENFDREWDMLMNCIAMALEEERMIQVKVAKLEGDLELLKIEIDDQEADLDMTCTKEIEFVEQLRRQEISRGLGLATRDRIRAVRRERMRWAVRDVRRNVIKGSRKDLQRFAEEARTNRPLEVEQTVSYEKRRDRERDEEMEVRRKEKSARRERFVELKAKGEGSLAVREVYDAVVSGVRDIIASSTFDLRRAKHDYRGRGPDEVALAASAAATAAAATAREAGGILGDTDDAVAVAVAAAATTAATDVGGPELGGGHVCRACGGPRFGRVSCAGCGASAHSWKVGVDAEGIA